MEYNVPQRVIRDIIKTAEKHDIEKVILFGSRARGNHTERSDIDLAVSGGNFDGFYWGIKENVKSDELKNEIEKDGIVIYEKA